MRLRDALRRRRHGRWLRRQPGDAGTWTVPLLMMSCRAMGRGVIDALLAWLAGQAARRAPAG